MTNLEWLKTLSAEELADWLYDEWLHHLQYRWSSSRGGLIIWLKDCKDEPTGYNLSPVDKDVNVRSKDEPKLSEIPTSKCHYEPTADGILFKGNLKEGDYKLIKTTNGWVLEGNDIAYCGEPQTGEMMTEEEFDSMLARVLTGKDEPQTERRCDECVHFDMPYRKIDEDGYLVIGVECDGADEVCDKWQTDCPWK